MLFLKQVERVRLDKEFLFNLESYKTMIINDQKL